MKQINEYLSTKVDAKALSKSFGFPEILDKDKIIEFLKENGFKCEYVSSNGAHTYNEAVSIIENSFSAMFIVGEFKDINEWSKYIFIGKGGNISKNNPIFFIRISEDLIRRCENTCFMCWTKHGDISGTSGIKLGSYENFIEKINNTFEF